MTKPNRDTHVVPPLVLFMAILVSVFLPPPLTVVAQGTGTSGEADRLHRKGYRQHWGTSYNANNYIKCVPACAFVVQSDVCVVYPMNNVRTLPCRQCILMSACIFTVISLTVPFSSHNFSIIDPKSYDFLSLFGLGSWAIIHDIWPKLTNSVISKYE